MPQAVRLSNDFDAEYEASCAANARRIEWVDEKLTQFMNGDNNAGLIDEDDLVSDIAVAFPETHAAASINAVTGQDAENWRAMVRFQAKAALFAYYDDKNKKGGC